MIFDLHNTHSALTERKNELIIMITTTFEIGQYIFFYYSKYFIRMISDTTVLTRWPELRDWRV